MLLVPKASSLRSYPSVCVVYLQLCSLARIHIRLFPCRATQSVVRIESRLICQDNLHMDGISQGINYPYMDWLCNSMLSTVCRMNADTYLKALGTAFRQRREKLGMTNEQVAEAADINVNYYARIERGEINTSVRKLVSIADALVTDFSKLAAVAEKQLKSE